jgi:hypothetical protein
MARTRSVNELKAEADKVLQEARKKQAILLKEAKEIESKNFASLGEKVIEYFCSKCSIDDVKKLAIELGFMADKQEKAGGDIKVADEQ